MNTKQSQAEARDAAFLKLFREPMDDSQEATCFKLGFNAGVLFAQAPVDAVLWCPNCFEQHIDEARPDICETCGKTVQEHWAGEGAKSIGCEDFKTWTNPPHKSHRCEFCNHVWRPAEGPTNGVQSLRKQGERDGSAKPVAFANKKDFDEAVEIASRFAQGQWQERPAPYQPAEVKTDVS